ncbi:hypothetical protein KOI35_44415 [Actinoplanes bogorensis]|uniref:Uncharacterized protein n=1 Tax=Paractinoplanes bogorensis TaxID=1610840 RepID=A0ABS5Z4G8_9ACTN|nr:hypothetical protein [Actinoplanes bogorensis]MBU2670567.1 hypothetical protein [Actinoplanes bogorensis]
MASYPRALAMAALQATLSGTWIAAGDLSPARRRLTRAGAVAVIGAIGYAVSPSSSSSSSAPDGPVSLRLVAPGSEHSLGIAAPDPTSGDPAAPIDPASPGHPASPKSLASPSGPASSEPDGSFDKRKAVLAAGVMGLSVAALAGRRVLEKRWRARLASAGHAHPTRALAVRMAGVEFAVQLALQLADMRKADKAR